MKPLNYYWYQTSLQARFISLLLLPISWLYCAIATIRRKLYQRAFKKSYSAEVPVIIVGNIVVGGSGKTPLLISLCEFIKQSGFKPGIVSRGYGGNILGVKQVQPGDSAKLVGDEPLMIAQKTEVPVVVGADRVAAMNFLLKNNQCDIVLSDDGMQHYSLQRDLEIAVVDADRLFGNGFCLPAGPLRERISRLDDVDIVVYNGDPNDSNACFYMLQFTGLNHLNRDENASLEFLSGKRVHAVAGIGNPLRFYNQLRNRGIDVIEHVFADHHAYTAEDFSGWSNDCIVMTEKDAVKCRDFLLPDAWVVCVSAEFSATLKSRLNSDVLPLLK